MSGEASSGGGSNHIVKIVIGAVGGVGTLIVVFLHPYIEKKGAEFAGVKNEGGGETKPQIVVVQTPGVKDNSGAAPIVMLNGAGTEQSSGSISAPEASASYGNQSATIVIATPSQLAAPRPPHNIKNDISIPHFDSTEQVEYIESEAKGEGTTRQIALSRALSEAVSKRLGSQISDKAVLGLNSVSIEENGRTFDHVDQSLRSKYESATDGLIKWWDIKSEEDDGQAYTIEVVAVVAKIKIQAAVHSTRKTLAVLPFKVDADASLIGRTVPADAIGKQFRESALTYLVNSRKFAVLDKTFTDELDRLAGEHPSTDPIQQAIDAAMKLGAQYAVVGLVNGLGVTERQVGGMKVPIVDGSISLRIIELSSRQTVLASAFQVADMPDLDLSGAHPENSIADTLGRAMAERTLETIYPFKVAALNGPDEVILNRGGDDLSVGQQFDLCNPGEEIKDPSTGESLGVAERKVATVEVIRVTPKTSYAKVIAKTEDIMAGAICRKPQQPAAETKAKAAPAQNEIDNLFK